MTFEVPVLASAECVKPINSEEEFQEFISRKG